MMSAWFAGKVDQCFGVDGPIDECEAGGAEMAVALFVNCSHQHIIQTWTKDRSRNMQICHHGHFYFYYQPS